MMCFIEITVIILLFVLSPLGFSPELYLSGFHTRYREKAIALSDSKKYLFVENSRLLSTMLASENNEILALGKEFKKITIFYYFSIAIFCSVVIAVFALDNKGLFFIFGGIMLLLIARIIYIYKL